MPAIQTSVAARREFGRSTGGRGGLDVLGLIEDDDLVDEGTFLPERREFFRRGHGQRLVLDEVLEIADRGQGHHCIAEPVGTAYDQRPL
jgi:hypothetical protein